MRLFISIVLLLFLTASCDEKLYTGDVDCEECYTEMPQDADLVIDLTLNSRYWKVPVTVYKGDVENNIIVASDTAYDTPFYVYVPVNNKYSVKVEYKKNDAVLYIIDGTKLKVKSVSDACDESCYVIEGEYLDARIKKEFLGF
jgi:hypothetical protein